MGTKSRRSSRIGTVSSLSLLAGMEQEFVWIVHCYRMVNLISDCLTPKYGDKFSLTVGTSKVTCSLEVVDVC